MVKKVPNRIMEAIFESAEGLHRLGIMSDAEFEEIAHSYREKLDGIAKKLSGEEIRQVREQAHLSQASFARALSVTAGYVSQLERGVKHASGPVLVLLNAIRTNGIEIVQH